MKNEFPLVSVCIPTYNCPEGLRRTLECITGQTYKNLEIIVSDNCSPGPEAEAVAREFMEKDPRIQYFRQQENKGGAFNFKFVLEKATGEYFMWAADDDEWEPTFVEECMRAFDDNTVLVFSHAKTHNRKQEMVREQVMPKLSKGKSKFENLVALYKNFAPSIIYGIHRTDNLRKVIDPYKIFDLIGYYWQTKILLSGNIVIVDKFLYTAGIDEYEYVKKPIKPREDRTFVYSPCLIATLRLINSGSLRLSEKIRLHRLILKMLCNAYLAHENEHTRKTLRNRLKYLLVRLASFFVGPNLPWGIAGHLQTLATNPREFFAKLRRKFSVHDYFYHELLKKGIVKYDPLNKSYIRSIKGNRFHLNPQDTALSRVLARDGIREKESVDALYGYVTPDMTILDLGANIGFYVVLESQIVSKGSGKVVAVEPSPENIRFLRLNVETNNYGDCVEIYEGAICDRSGTVEMELTSASNSCHLAKLYTSRTNLGTIDVPAFTFPKFLKHAGITMKQLDFLRMDIEGAEYEILPDIMDLLENKTSFLMFIEFHPDVDKCRHIEALKNLESMGFKCLTATKEYPKDGKIVRVHRPDTTMKQLYTEEIFLQRGGCEVFLKKG